MREERRRAFSKEDIKGTERGAREGERQSYGKRERKREERKRRACERGGQMRAREWRERE